MPARRVGGAYRVVAVDRAGTAPASGAGERRPPDVSRAACIAGVIGDVVADVVSGGEFPAFLSA
ncbi:hypothetical protein [Streptomyces malaysiense]|uniref:hypothetical protein n=1 Tax=Streptomyces malaysiense TaxID=1428626 RepID=UPI00116078E0|nr:hypothetical protein [Streptomyces malaysiense]